MAGYNRFLFSSFVSGGIIWGGVVWGWCKGMEGKGLGVVVVDLDYRIIRHPFGRPIAKP